MSLLQVYKSLNTFIDDLFAFIIKMPTMHRLSCFRDDIIFLIYLYQRYIYPVDKKRVNEFGQITEENKVRTFDNSSCFLVPEPNLILWDCHEHSLICLHAHVDEKDH